MKQRPSFQANHSGESDEWREIRISSVLFSLPLPAEDRASLAAASLYLPLFLNIIWVFMGQRPRGRQRVFMMSRDNSAIYL